MNARRIANVAYMLLTEGLDDEGVGRLDAALFEGALDDNWQEEG